MDESVRNAMSRWPDVPAVYGYIGVNRRGEFLLQGHIVTHERTREFIHRNYTMDEHGRAYFQNGPQRAYADLEATPWIYRVMDDGSLRTHTERPASELRSATITTAGEILLVTEHGPGMVHAQDLDQLSGCLTTPEPDLATALESLQAREHGPVMLELPAGKALLGIVDENDLPSQFAYTQTPQPAAGETRAATSSYRPAWLPDRETT